MQRLHTGLILLDRVDIFFLSLSLSSGIGLLIRKYYSRRAEDPIVNELKKRSSVIVVATNGEPLKLPLVRGGETLEAVSIVLRSKRLARLIRTIRNVIKKQRQLKLLHICFYILNETFTSSVGLRIALGGSLDYTQVILIAVPSTVGGFLLGLTIANPLTTVLLPLAILYARGIENVPDPDQKCRLLCKVAAEFHKKNSRIEMTNFDSLVEDASTALQKANFICVEEKISLLERYKLKELVKTARGQKRVQHFSEFIKKFPECDADPVAVYEQVVEKVGP